MQSELKQYLLKRILVLKERYQNQKNLISPQQDDVELQKECNDFLKSKSQLESDDEIILTKYNHLQQFRIEENLKNLEQVGFNYLGRVIAQLPNLLKLSLIFKQCYQLGDLIDTKILSEGIASLKNLTHLQLEFSQIQTNFNNQSFYGLAHIFKTLVHLKELTLCFGSDKQSQEGYQIFLDSLLYLKEITHFTYYNRSENQFFNEQVVSDLCQRIQQLKSLKSFEIHIDEWNGFSCTCLKILGEAIQQLVNLKQLSLKIKRNSIKSIGILELAQNILPLSKLRYLNLWIHTQRYVNNEGFISLYNTISSFSQLKKLKLIIGENKIGDEGAFSLGQSFKQLSQLNFLKLYILQNQFSSKGAIEIANGIAYLINLNKLKYQNENDYQDEFPLFYQKLKSLQQLKSLQVNEKYPKDNALLQLDQYFECPNVQTDLVEFGIFIKSNKDIQFLISALFKLKNLIRLKLNFLFIFGYQNEKQLLNLAHHTSFFNQLRIIKFGSSSFQSSMHQVLKRKNKRLIILE